MSATVTDLMPVAPVAPPPALRRTAEVWLAGAGMVLSALFLGAFTLVVNRLDEGEFTANLYPEMQRIGLDLAAGGAAADAYDAARTLAAWFGVTLMVVLLLGATGVFVARRRPGRRTTGWFFAAAGLVCLVGSQLILYPVAFLFFVSAGMFALRRPGERPDLGSTR
ncbi:hypothetical protein [Promicromonospora panici]|uniref:hypothetical protein n=1 Tax=Promicromonospora panici TaxID=2219658 RepID=UPI00101CA9EA|nr:hypothetical protein [Promicromonospora panici]